MALTGKTVLLRELSPSDAEPLARWLEDPEVAEHLMAPRAAGSDYFAEVARSARDLVLGVCRLSGDLVGVVALHDVDEAAKQAALAVIIAKEHWGRGYASDAVSLITRHAFEDLGLERVWLRVANENARAVRAYERAGYRRSGPQLMELSRSEWVQGRERGAG